ncbi:L-aspartate oxidase [Agromyces seonyuensis]|uniref:L-aspartate oxidase n=1 Tax=Agromyces seonyuensis TaxID=2662446 RepID=A0A6I4P422_9MICO|nr:L-aspartate oxidase [Agromyces seonyuensis]MWB98147.1 L-aspartate oxidase [Agromyces seonyuensis]
MRVLVIGSGLAGLATAIGAHDAGHDVRVVTKAAADAGSTALAQGGIAAAVFPGDSVQRHIDDTLAAGAGLSDAHAVRVLCEEGPAAVRELIRHGVPFDRDASGMARGLEAAHSRPRILHAGGDSTGRAVEDALLAAVRSRGIEVVERAMLVDLRLAGGRAVGARMLIDDDLVDLDADAVVLATGGWGQLYGRTTSPAVATGDGVAAALRAGAAVADLEFTQFHPTALAVEGAPLISEAVRGEGAILVDESGHRFLLDDDPRGELAPRDVVARGVHRAMLRQGGRPVLLDATALGAEFLARRFPGIDRIVREHGFDWAASPIPAAPAAHYAMGGVVVDDLARTGIPGLSAVGEVARTGVHGANRLASNSLLEAAVFAARAVEGLDAPGLAHAGRGAAQPRIETDAPGLDTALAGLLDRRGATSAGRRAAEPRLETDARGLDTALAGLLDRRGAGLLDRRGAGLLDRPFSRSALQALMHEHVGLVRDADGLTAALAQLEAWSADLPSEWVVPAGATPSRPAMPTHSREGFEDRNLLELGLATVRAALARTESVGAHYRSDDEHAAALQPVEEAA